MKKLAYYRPAIACFLAMMTYSLFSNGLSFFVSIVSADLGVGRGSFSLYYSLMAVSGALVSPVLGRIAGQKGVRKLLMLSGIWSCICLFLLSFASRLWMFYAIGLAAGLMGNACVMLSVNVALQKNYDSKTVSALMGVVMAGSGVGGMILSALVPRMLEHITWRMGYRVLGVAWLGMALLCVLVMGKEKPMQAAVGAQKAAAGAGMTQSQMMKLPKMYLLLAESIILAASCGILQQYPALLGGMGFETGKVAAMMSLMTASLALGKIGLSVLYSTAAVRKGGCIAIGIFVVGLILLIWPATVYPALVLSAVGLGVYTTLMPLATRSMFGAYSFATAWGIVQMAGSAGSFVGVPVWGAVYDATGSYVPALVGFAVLLAAALVIHLVAASEKFAYKETE